MFSKLKALVVLEKFRVIIFSIEFSLPSMVSYVKVKFQVIVFMCRAKIDNTELSLPSNSMYHRKIQTYMYRFCPELLLWQHTQSFDIWRISLRLEVLPLTQKYQTQQKDLDSTVPDDASMCIVLRLNQVTLRSKFNLDNVTCIYTSVCSIMFYYFGGDLKYE